VTKRGEGVKLVVAGGSGLPFVLSVAGNSAHEVTLVEQALKSISIEEKRRRTIENRAYDSDPLDIELEHQCIGMIASYCRKRKKPKTKTSAS
jgi:hypothetical protein